jgi:predicted ribosomally synthesized peptide with SipW-like signal peptide
MTTLSIALSRGQRFKLVLFGALAIGLLATMAGRGTLAYFTTQTTSTANTFTAGNLHFQIADNNDALSAVSDTTSGTVTGSIKLSDIKPGDTIYAPVSIKNAGSLDAQWGISYTTSGSTPDLANALQMGIVGRGSASATTSAADCTPAGFVDAPTWPERILAVAAMTPAGPTAVVDYTLAAAPTGGDGAFAFGDVATSSLPLLHSATDMLCLQVKFPDDLTLGAPDGITHDNAWNGVTNSTYSTTLVFTFNGQQRNHPVVMDETAAPVTGNH